MNHVLVTGANGFVGGALCRALRNSGHRVTGLVRRPVSLENGIDCWIDPSVNFAAIDTTWPDALRVDCVVHLAARVHVMHEEASDPDAEFRIANVEGALRVASAASRRGARRFVFVSSIKALAECDMGYPLREDDPPTPHDAYGRSKLVAEHALWRFGQESGMDVVIVRPPLVYGPQVRANFLRLIEAISRGIPLPLAWVTSRRSLIYVENLADALMRCVTDPRAAHQCFHVADADALTVAELARSLGRHLNHSARLFPVPPRFLHFAGKLAGRSAQIDRLVGSLELDTSRIRNTLEWQPPHSIDEGLAATAAWYRSTH